MIAAHRGASAVAPESTAAAIRAAARAGARMIELDVQMTRDGRLVIFHDDRLERTTNGRGRLAKTPYASLARLDAGAWFHPRFAGARVLLLSQALRLIPRRMRVNLELKSDRRIRALVRRVGHAVRRDAGRHDILLSSFDRHLLALVGRRRSARALICNRRPDQSLAHAIRAGLEAWHPQAALVTAARVARAHAAGCHVQAWTVDGLLQARRLSRQGVDGIFTNDPGKFRGRA